MDQSTVEEVYNNSYFKINKILLINSGLWPYRSKKEKLVYKLIIYITMCFVLIPNVNGCRVWCGVDFCLCGENLAACMYSLIVILKYYTTSLSEPKIQKVHEQVAANWITITDAAERSILLQYAKRGKLLSIAYTVYMASGGIAFSQATVIPAVLDLIFPLNQSRDKILIVRGEYFVNPFDYYYQLYIAYCIATFISLGVLTSIDTAYTEVVHQNLGILAIVKYRLHKATEYYNDNRDIIYDAIVEAIRLHQAALEFVDMIESSYSLSLLILIGLFVVSLSVGVVVIMEQLDDTYTALRFSMMAAGVLMLLFYVSYSGQQLFDHGSDIFLHIYMNKWYIASQKAKTLIRIMMLRCLNPPELTAGKLYVMNYQNYGVIVKTIASYVTVFASFQST